LNDASNSTAIEAEDDGMLGRWELAEYDTTLVIANGASAELGMVLGLVTWLTENGHTILADTVLTWQHVLWRAKQAHQADG
jgi:hypothetical protein